MTNKHSSDICFIGNGSIFSLAAFEYLIDHQQIPSQIILAGFGPASRQYSSIQVAAPRATPQINSLAQQHNIPLTYIAQAKDLENVPFPLQVKPRYILMACFPYRLSAAFIRWPTEHCLNIHPSILPAYRGPNPLFWQLHHDESHTGVTLHLVTESFDSGSIVAQTSVQLPSGATCNELDSLLATQGSKLFCHWLNGQKPQPIKQNEKLSSYQPNPEEADYTLSTQWSAKKAFNFIRGTPAPENGYPVNLNGKTIYLIEALEFTTDKPLTKAQNNNKQYRWIQFSSGALFARIMCPSPKETI